MKKPAVRIDREYDGNIIASERPTDGHVVERPVGWRWVVEVDGVTVQDFGRLGEAEHFVRMQYGAAAIPKRKRRPR